MTQVTKILSDSKIYSASKVEDQEGQGQPPARKSLQVRPYTFLGNSPPSLPLNLPTYTPIPEYYYHLLSPSMASGLKKTLWFLGRSKTPLPNDPLRDK